VRRNKGWMLYACPPKPLDLCSLGVGGWRRSLAQAGLPAENVYCRRALHSVLFLVFKSALRNLYSAIGYADFSMDNT